VLLWVCIFSDCQPHYKTRHTILVRCCFLQLTPSTTNHTSHLLTNRLPTTDRVMDKSNPLNLPVTQLLFPSTTTSHTTTYCSHTTTYCSHTTTYCLSTVPYTSAYTSVPFNHSPPLHSTPNPIYSTLVSFNQHRTQPTIPLPFPSTCLPHST
jgi:hypothetical protein